MQKTQKKSLFNPYHRYEHALGRILSKSDKTSDDIWENKLYDILKLRELFKSEYKEDYKKQFENSYPLYSGLLDAFEDTRIAGDRAALEAMLICSVDLAKTAETIQHPRFDSLFMGTYRKLFYDIVPVLCNPTLIFQCIIAPMTSADTDKLAVGNIWKILALSGGAALLKRKGFGTDAVKAEDVEYLLQLACYRHCSSLLQYTASGTKFFKDNPLAGSALATLVSFDSVRGNGRRTDYLGELSEISKSNFNNLLTGELKLLSVPDDQIAELAKYDGQFNPEISNTLEYNKHIVFIDEE